MIEYDDGDEQLPDRLYEAIQRHDAEINPFADDTTWRTAHWLLRRALTDCASDADVDLDDDEIHDPPLAQIAAGLSRDAVCVYLAQYGARRLAEIRQSTANDDAGWLEAFAEICEKLFTP
ncbi:MAG TPA: hypothetical protein VLL82_15080 [Mycobacterium sp.]|nr:hypothetical protein [Mycobacterium sp.]